MAPEYCDLTILRVINAFLLPLEQNRLMQTARLFRLVPNLCLRQCSSCNLRCGYAPSVAHVLSASFRIVGVETLHRSSTHTVALYVLESHPGDKSAPGGLSSRALAEVRSAQYIHNKRVRYFIISKVVDRMAKAVTTRGVALMQREVEAHHCLRGLVPAQSRLPLLAVHQNNAELCYLHPYAPLGTLQNLRAHFIAPLGALQNLREQLAAAAITALVQHLRQWHNARIAHRDVKMENIVVALNYNQPINLDELGVRAQGEGSLGHSITAQMYADLVDRALGSHTALDKLIASLKFILIDYEYVTRNTHRCNSPMVSCAVCCNTTAHPLDPATLQGEHLVLFNTPTGTPYYTPPEVLLGLLKLRYLREKQPEGYLNRLAHWLQNVGAWLYNSLVPRANRHTTRCICYRCMCKHNILNTSVISFEELAGYDNFSLGIVFFQLLTSHNPFTMNISGNSVSTDTELNTEHILEFIANVENYKLQYQHTKNNNLLFQQYAINTKDFCAFSDKTKAIAHRLLYDRSTDIPNID